jgi:hypothetical protein
VSRQIPRFRERTFRKDFRIAVRPEKIFRPDGRPKIKKLKAGGF